MKYLVIKWGYWALGVATGFVLCLIADEVFPQTCSGIGERIYCDSRDGSMIIAPTGRDRGVILGPGNQAGTYAVTPATKPSSPIAPPSRIYLDSGTTDRAPILQRSRLLDSFEPADMASDESEEEE